MYKLLFAASLALSLGTFTQAQAQPSRDDTTTITSRKFKLLIITNPDSSEMARKEQARKGEIVLDNNDDAKPSKNSRRKQRDTGLRFDLGVNGLLQDNSFTYSPRYDSLSLRYGKSISVNFTQLYGVPIVKNNVLLLYGLGLEMMNLRFDEPVTLVRDPLRGANIDTLAEGGLRKSKLAATYLHLPLMLEYKSGNEYTKKAFRLAVGGEAALLLSSHTKIVREDEGDRTKDKVYGQQNLSPFKASAIARVGYGDFGLFFRYGLTDMFRGTRDAGVTTFSVGLTLASL